MLHLILFLVSNIIISYTVEKKSRVLNVAHSVLFVFLLTMFMFVIDDPIIRSVMIRFVGDLNYHELNQALIGPVAVAELTFSAYMVFEICLFIFVTLSLIRIANKIIEYVSDKKIDIDEIDNEAYVCDDEESVVVYKKIYLENCSLRL